MKLGLERIKGKEMKLYVIFTMVYLLIGAFICGTPEEIIEGMRFIVVSRDALITDYFELAGLSASLFNAALVFGIAFVLIITEKIPFTGLTMAALFINAGYALWGKNPINILPILLGTEIYARSHGVRLNRYIYTALFGTCLAPLITEFMFLFPYAEWMNLIITIALGIFIGFVLPPLSAHTASMHMGYNLLNVGFSGGVLAFVIVCILRSLGMECDSVLIWSEGRDKFITIGLFGYFILTAVFGFWINGGTVRGLRRLFQHPGRAVTDFVLMDGAGVTLMNMGIVGIISTAYIILINGDFSGPVVGAILTAFGFAAFGAHAKNYLPVLLGVFLSTFVTRYTPDTPGIQLAAVFAVGLAPIAGQFGVLAGICAGFLHAAIVMCTSQMYGGLNLYNNGFSAGWVAIVMVPVIEGFMKNFYEKKNGN